jgi:prepilin-type N-terminal cleavage/methylation domain-containing protein
MQRDSSRKAFSLVELLTVIGILAIVMALVAPAVTGFGRSTTLVTGGNMVTNMITLARQRAISGNTMTALVLLTDQGSDADYRAWTIVEYTVGGRWAQVGKWEILPTGITVDCTDIVTTSSFLSHSPRPFPFLTGSANPPVAYQQAPIRDPEGYAARLFLPNGGLQNPEHPARIRLVEGFSQVGQTKYSRPSKDGKPVNFYDVAIVGATGIAKVDRP